MMFVSFNRNLTGVTIGAATTYPSVFCKFRVSQSLVFCVVFRITLFVILSFFFWALHCLSFYLWFLITHLVSSNFFLILI